MKVVLRSTKDFITSRKNKILLASTKGLFPYCRRFLQDEYIKLRALARI